MGMLLLGPHPSPYHHFPFQFSGASARGFLLPPKGSEQSARELENGEESGCDNLSSDLTEAASEKEKNSPRQKISVTSPPTIAIVVDDVGDTENNLTQWLSINAPLTFAVMPHRPFSSSHAERLWQAGYQIIMHIPTENTKPHSFSGTGQLSLSMDRETVFRTLDADLANIPHVVGINNHQGSAGCDSLQLMTFMCEWARERGFFVVDSNSSRASKVSQAAQSLGMPRRCNEVFIDHDNNPDYIRSAMRNLAEKSRKNGVAIGICHFHRPNTPRIVGEDDPHPTGRGDQFRLRAGCSQLKAGLATCDWCPIRY